MHLDFLVPYRWNRGDFRFPRRLSLCLSVRPSVHSVSVHSVFRTFLSHPLRYWLQIWYTTSSWHDTDQVWLLSRLTYFYLSYCPLQKCSSTQFSALFSVMLWDIDLKFGIRPCCLLQKLIFPDFPLLSCDIDLTYYTDQVWFLLRLTWLHTYFLLFKFSFPHFSLSSCNWHQVWGMNLLAGLQGNSCLWIDDVCLSVRRSICPSVCQHFG